MDQQLCWFLVSYSIDCVIFRKIIGLKMDMVSGSYVW